jgi:hypothetical protein
VGEPRFRFPGTSGADEKFGSESTVSLGLCFFAVLYGKTERLNLQTNHSEQGIKPQGVKENETDAPCRLHSATTAYIVTRPAQSNPAKHAPKRCSGYSKWASPVRSQCTPMLRNSPCVPRVQWPGSVEPFVEKQPEVQKRVKARGVQAFMSDSRIYLAGSAAQLARDGDSAHGHNSLENSKRAKGEQEQEHDPEPAYVATSPAGTTLHIPKELFVALSDFMQTRKCPGSITIQFRKGEIVCVEAVAKKTYRHP